MDGWGQATEKDDGIKYQHDEITCKMTQIETTEDAIVVKLINSVS